MLTAGVMTIGDLAIEAVRRNARAFVEHTALLGYGAESDDAERHVHQARVATRRLRAALRLFADVLPPEACGERDELQWIANQLGPLRDLDVQLRRLASSAEALRETDALEPYAAWLAAERARALSPLCAAMASDRFAALRGRLEGTDRWQPAEPAEQPPPGERIAGAMKPLRKATDNLHEPPAPMELHRVRIRAKRARYTVEFFEQAYGKPATRLLERLVAIQELLGGLQDSIVAQARVEQAIAIGGAAWPTATVLALGRLQQYESEQVDAARVRFEKVYRDAEKAWKRFDPSPSKLAIS